MKAWQPAVIGLGTNLGDKTANMQRAGGLLAAAAGVRVTAISRLYRSNAWGIEDQDWFLNGCIGVETSLSPEALLDVCQEIENALGRVREKKWGPRVIDLDLLLYGEVAQSKARLTLPHPLITERAFVLAPLRDVAGDIEIKGKRLSAWLDETGTNDIAVMDEPSQQAWRDGVLRSPKMPD